jgi:glycosyltransferase involved in cell wall biosynthesis
MKIIYNISSTATNGGGMERVIVNKVNYLADILNYEVILITTDQRGGSSFYPYSDKIRLIELDLNYDLIAKERPFIKSYYHYRLALVKHRDLLTSILLSEKADIVVSLSRDEKEFLHKINDGSKKVLESHRCLKPRAPIEIRKPKSWFLKLKILYRLIHETRLPKFYDKFVVLTHEDRAFWSEKNNVAVIPNPLPFETELRADMSAKRVLCVGRISTDKGIDRLLSIWGKTFSKFPDWKLVLVGDVVNPELVEVANNSNFKNSVQIIPPTREILQEYLKSSVFVMTSRFEGLPMVLLESISVGLPIVSYTFKCGPKDIINDDIDGFLAPEDDEELFVEKLEHLLNSEDLRTKMSAKAIENSQRFTLKEVMKQWDSLFRELIQN